MSKHKQEEEHDNTERWLLTYSDLITLMMAFFVILFAMASVDASKFKNLSQSLAMAFGTGGTSGGSNMISDYSGTGFKNMVSLSEDDELTSLVKRIQDYAQKNGMSQKIHAAVSDRGLVINLADSVLFDSGKAVLDHPAMEILDKMGEFLFSSTKMIRVEGHTDNIPIHSGRYLSNWQLSTDRATNVIMYWISKRPQVADCLSAGGYGEFRPIASNATPEGRALNRRVDIVVLRSATAAKQEPQAKGPQEPSQP
jgi:chemotaxis protein MotB